MAIDAAARKSLKVKNMKVGFLQIYEYHWTRVRFIQIFERDQRTFIEPPQFYIFFLKDSMNNFCTMIIFGTLDFS
jgi:hypothetical protein